MDTTPTPFVPPAPVPRTSPPSLFELIRIVYRNPLELWGEPSYNEPWISVSGAGGPLVIANDPGLIRHILVDNARNYKLATVRQKILRPILRNEASGADTALWLAGTRPSQPEHELVWFDRAARPAHVYERTKTTKDTPQSLVAYLEAELARQAAAAA